MGEQKHYTRFEKARIIGARALQIARGAPILIETDLNDPIKIAELEFDKSIMPLEVKLRAPPKLESS